MDKFLFVHGGLDDPTALATDKQGLSVPPNRSAIMLGSHSYVGLSPMTVMITYSYLPEAQSVKLQGFASQNLVLITNFLK